MKFTYKTDEELSKMTSEQRDIYAEQKRQHEAAEARAAMKAEFVAMFKAFFGFPEKKADGTKDDTEVTFDAIKTKMVSSGISKEEFNEVKELVNQWKENNGVTGGDSVQVQYAKQIKEQKETLKAILKGNGAEVTLKANTTRAAISDNPYQILIPGLGQLLRLARGIYERFTKVNLPVGTHNGTIRYVDWDEATTVKAAAVLAEAAVFPESTAKFKTYSADLKKIGDSLPVTDEFFEDEAVAAAELDAFLERNVDAAVDNQLVNGDNTGDNLKGLLVSVPAYNPVAQGIVDANIYDLITVMEAAITTPGGAKYKPDMAVMNKRTMNLLVLHKDAMHNYQFPPNHPIFSMITIDNNMADDTLVVGDSRFGTIYEMGGVTLSRGLINAQFTTDLITLKARKRLLLLIRNSDMSGFRKIVGIANALSILEAPVA